MSSYPSPFTSPTPAKDSPNAVEGWPAFKTADGDKNRSRFHFAEDAGCGSLVQQYAAIQ
jgi:hypothetical protein